MIRTTESLAREFAALGYAALTGLAMGVFYDIFRIIRRVFRCNYATVVSQDLFFWMTSAVCVFFAAIITGDGIVRVNYVAGTLITALLYCMTLGSVIVGAVSAVLIFVKKIAQRLWNAVCTGLLVPIRGKMMRLFEKMKKSRKKSE